MGDRALLSFVISGFSTPGIVDDLMRDNDVAGSEIRPNTADRGYRNDADSTAFPERPDIPPIIYFMRRNSVAITVTRKKSNRATTNLTEGNGTRGFAIRRSQHFAMRDVQIGQLRQAATANDGQHLIPPSWHRLPGGSATHRECPCHSRTRNDPEQSARRNRLLSAFLYHFASRSPLQ